ncbi:MAG TPA: hypothetical protein VNT27_13885, partial [Propionibacteriaceae bacterium]|nr:hypothetical protein [Propionibacteriaceae bacterium]
DHLPVASEPPPHPGRFSPRKRAGRKTDTAHRTDFTTAIGRTALGQAAPLRPLSQRTTSETNTVRRHDRLGGLLHEYHQVA